MPPETSGDPNVRLILSGYKLDSAVLPAPQRSQLRTFAGNVMGRIRGQKGATVSLQIVGHTDSSGTERHNTALAFNRAQGVQQILESFFAPEARSRARFQLVAAGEYNPIASNATEPGRAVNRRVEVKAEYVIPEKPHPPTRRAAPQRQAPPSLSATSACIKFEEMKRSFGPVFEKLTILYGATDLWWEGEGPITLITVGQRNRIPGAAAGAIPKAIAGAIEEVKGGVIGKVKEDVTAIVLDKTLGEGAGEELGGLVGFIPEFLLFAHEQRENLENAEIMRHPHSREYVQEHRKLVAAKVSEGLDRGDEDAVFYAHKLEMDWTAYEMLLSACNQSRGITSTEQKVRAPTPADRGTGNPFR